MGHMLEPHWCQCVVSLSKTLSSLYSAGSSQEDPSLHSWKIVDWYVKIKSIKQKLEFVKTLLSEE